MKNVFVTCTQHHICLALALIEQKKLSNNIIIFFCPKSAINGDPFFNSLSKVKPNGLYEIYFVYPDDSVKYFGPFKIFKRIYANRMMYKNIKDIIGLPDVCNNIYVFNDERHETQFVVSSYKKSIFTFVQDGLAQYIYHIIKPRKFYKLWYYKILFGFFWRPIEQHGDYHNYSSMYLMLPELVHSRVRIPTKKIENKSFYNNTLVATSKDLIINEFPEFFSFDKKSILVFLPFFFNKKLSDLAKKELRRLFKIDGAERVYIKNHPRGKFKIDFTSDSDGNKFINIPDGIPAECFFALSNDRDVKYYLVPSTLLVIAGAILKEDQVRVIFKDIYDFADKLIKDNKKFYEYLVTKLGY